MDTPTAIGLILILGVVYYGFKRIPDNSKTMLTLFDALFETIKDAEDIDFQGEYNQLKNKYQDDKGNFVGVKDNDLFMLRRDVRTLLLDIKRKYPDLKTIVEVKTDGEIVLDTGVRI
tara:strand:- start:174 stop:524 length:351 start_codon:yes stop_codon:yes gene_type:complete